MNTEIVHQCESLGQMETHEVVCLLVELAREVSDVIGEKGAISVFHQAGKQVGKRLGKESGKGAEDDAREVALHFFRRKSFMESICVNKDNEAEVQGCKIGLVLQDEHSGAIRVEVQVLPLKQIPEKQQQKLNYGPKFPDLSY